VQAIGLKVSPTYGQDDIQSVTLKSFRKVIGYDTFNSILKEDRDETKDPADYYNVTVSMMIKRNPLTAATYDKYTNADGKTLGQVIDKGFPYDDGDSTLTEKIKDIKKAPAGAVLAKLNGENITKEHLISLIKDTTVPVTQSLAQVKSSSEVAAKPAPITTKLAQIEKSDVKLAQTSGSPVTVNPESMMMSNTMASTRLGL
jgi:hypothetical protein